MSLLAAVSLASYRNVIRVPRRKGKPVPPPAAGLADPTDGLASPAPAGTGSRGVASDVAPPETA